MFNLLRRKPTVEEIANAASGMPLSPVEAFLDGMAFAGTRDPRRMILGVIDKALAPVALGIQSARQGVAAIQAQILGIRADARQAIANIRAERDGEITQLEPKIAALRDQLAALQKEQGRLLGIQDRFKAK